MTSPTAIKASKAEFEWNEDMDKGINEYLEEAATACTSENYLEKCFFYFTPNELNIYKLYNAPMDSHFQIRIDLNYIKEFLKVPLW